MRYAGLTGIVTALALGGCTSEFWDWDPDTHIALDSLTATGLRIDRIEVKSSYYSPADDFSEAFVPAFRRQTEACARGERGVRAVVFIHALDRGSDLIGEDGRAQLSGSVDLIDRRGRVVGRYPLSAVLSERRDDVGARRVALGDAFGRQLCREAFGG